MCPVCNRYVLEVDGVIVGRDVLKGWFRKGDFLRQGCSLSKEEVLPPRDAERPAKAMPMRLAYVFRLLRGKSQVSDFPNSLKLKSAKTVKGRVAIYFHGMVEFLM
ncbi:hypothetical protein A6U87_17605 [Rhizobium sp. AC44/96]|nr:hypothetical protein A6U87_17605 [Rhizobium sp. AC44/96]